MASDLKPMLQKVMASAGKKKMFFAYGLGKRKDGKGDGELVVRGKKIKKPEVEGELADCKEFLEGVCWSSPDGDTVFFQGKGKKLSPMIVAKMAITAKKEAGKQYDFQVPSPEQEAQVEKLAEGDGDEPAGAVPPAPPSPPGAQAAGTPPAAPPPPAPKAPPPPAGKPVDLQARLKSLVLRLKFVYGTAPALKGKLDPLFQSAVSLVQKGSADALPALDRLEAALNAVGPDGSLPDQAPPPPAAPPAPATDESAYLARVKALTEDLKKAIASGTEAGTEAKLRFSESQVFFRKKELPKATALLDVVEAQIKKALAGAAPAAGAVPKAPPPPAGAKAAAPGEGAVPKAPPPPPAGGDLAAQWKAKLAECAPAIKQALALKGPNAAAIAKLFAQASALAKPDGNMAQALATLTECHNLATAELAGKAPKTGEAGEGQAAPTVDPKSAQGRWAAERAVAVSKLQDEIKLIAGSGDPDAAKAELQLKAVLRQLTPKLDSQKQVNELLSYLDKDDVVAEICELAFDLKTPLLRVLNEIKSELPA